MSTQAPEATTSRLDESGQHGFKAHSDGGYVPVQTRSARFASTNVLDFPTVTGREAVWKLTPVATVSSLIEGDLDGSGYEFQAEPGSGIDITWVERTDARIGTAGIPEERASANAWSSFDKALAITVSGEEAAAVTVARSALGTAPRAAHTIIE